MQIDLNQFIPHGDNQNIFEGNKLPSLRCMVKDKSLRMQIPCNIDISYYGGQQKAWQQPANTWISASLWE